MWNPERLKPEGGILWSFRDFESQNDQLVVRTGLRCNAGFHFQGGKEEILWKEKAIKPWSYLTITPSSVVPGVVAIFSGCINEAQFIYHVLKGWWVRVQSSEATSFLPQIKNHVKVSCQKTVGMAKRPELILKTVELCDAFRNRVGAINIGNTNLVFGSSDFLNRG